MIYGLNLITGSKESVLALDERAQKLSDEITKYRGFPRNPLERSKLEWLAHDIKHLRFWNILNPIDGFKMKDDADKRLARLWAEEEFSYEKLEEMFNLAVNAALFADKKGAPGYDRGHTIIYEAIASNRQSMFYESLPEELHTKLINGMFWEMAGAINYDPHEFLENVLMNHFKDLRTAFAPKGVQLFSRASLCHKAAPLYAPENQGLSQKAIRKFGSFVKKLDERVYRMNLTHKDIQPLAQAYIDAVNGRDEWGGPILDDYKELRKDLFVLKYSRN